MESAIDSSSSVVLDSIAMDEEKLASSSARGSLDAVVLAFNASSTAPSANATATAAAPSQPPPAGMRVSSRIQGWREIEAVGLTMPRPGPDTADLGNFDSNTEYQRGQIRFIVNKLCHARDQIFIAIWVLLALSSSTRGTGSVSTTWIYARVLAASSSLNFYIKLWLLCCRCGVMSAARLPAQFAGAAAVAVCNGGGGPSLVFPATSMGVAGMRLASVRCRVDAPASIAACCIFSASGGGAQCGGEPLSLLGRGFVSPVSCARWPLPCRSFPIASTGRISFLHRLAIEDPWEWERVGPDGPMFGLILSEDPWGWERVGPDGPMFGLILSDVGLLLLCWRPCSSTPCEAQLLSGFATCSATHGLILHDIPDKQPPVMLHSSSTRWFFLWFWFLDSASTWDPGLSFIFVLWRRIQHHTSVAGVLLQCWLNRTNFNLRFARSIHPGACVCDAPAALHQWTRLRLHQRLSYLSFQLHDLYANVFWFSSENLYVIRLL